MKEVVTKFRNFFEPFFKRLLNQNLIYYFLITLVFFGAFIKPNFATDTYADAILPSSDIISNFLQGGRFITAILYCLSKLFSLDIRIVCLLSYILAIIAITIALSMLGNILAKIIPKCNKKIRFFIPILIIINPFAVELFLFVEKGIMALGILSCVIAAHFYYNYLRNHQKRNLAYSMISAIFATFCYQGVVGMFIVLAALTTVLISKNTKEFITNTVTSLLVYCIGPILNLSVTVCIVEPIVGSGRINGSIAIIDSLEKIVIGATRMLKVFNIMPWYIFWGGIALIILIAIISICRAPMLQDSAKSRYKKCTLMVMSILYLTVVAMLAALVPQIVQATESIWVVARSTYVFAALPGITLGITSAYVPDKARRYNLFTIGALSIIAIYLVFQMFGFYRIILHHYSTNEIDRLRAEQINLVINEYEVSHKTQISKIAPSKDERPTYSYPAFFSEGNINASAFSEVWSDVSIINYYAGRSFARKEAPSAWREYCDRHDWQSFSLEQIQFQDDTLLICWY